MLCAIEDVVSGALDDLVLASILPTRDRAQIGPDNARIAAADYRLWLLLIAPFCLLLWPVRRLALVRQFAAHLPILREFADADAVADVSGIAFVDGRGLPLLYYNAAIVLPPLFFDVPVHKLSQALGPFDNRLNRMVGRWVLSRCTTVAARGHRSLAHLHGLGITKAKFQPDTSFAMRIPAETYGEAEKQCLSKFPADDTRPLLILTPSAVVARYCQTRGINLAQTLAESLLLLESRGIRVALLSHSTDTGIEKNDDISVVRAIHSELGADAERFPVLDTRNDPRLARALMAQGDVYVASRFHSMIGALSQAVPVATIGWSHKYSEAARDFGMESFVIDFADLDGAGLVTKVMALLDAREDHRRRMLAIAQQMATDAAAGVCVVTGRKNP